MNERGVALPTALLALSILLTLMTAFAVLSATEPVIAGNHLKSARARALAEAGIERAIWALSNPTAAPGGLGDPLPSQMPSEYSGTFVSLSALGGFTLNVTNGAASNERAVVSVGWTPTNDASDTTPKGVKKIQTTVMRLRSLDPPCALCIDGSLEVGGHAVVDARSGWCAGGSAPIGGTMTTGTTTETGTSHQIFGPGNDVPNQSPEDIATGVSSSYFGFKLADGEITVLNNLAKANGTYFQGAQSFSTNPPFKSGIVFVDTTTGNLLMSSTPSSEVASVTIDGTFSWSGWLIVAGSLNVRGSPALTGLLYAQNDVNIRGSASIRGAIVGENRQSSSERRNSAESSETGNVTITYDCAAARDGGGTIPTSWFVKPGTFVQLDGQ